MNDLPDPPLLPDCPVPDADTVRRRLAHLVTETGVLRRQLLVSEKLARARERLQEQDRRPGVPGGGSNHAA